MKKTKWIKDAIDRFRSFLFPPFCICCNEKISSYHKTVCHACWDLFLDSIIISSVEEKVTIELSFYSVIQKKLLDSFSYLSSKKFYEIIVNLLIIKILSMNCSLKKICVIRKKWVGKSWKICAERVAKKIAQDLGLEYVVVESWEKQYPNYRRALFLSNIVMVLN